MVSLSSVPRQIIHHHLFYGNYDGHPPGDLELAISTLRRPMTPQLTQDDSDERALIFLAGDSSLDNKFWLGQRAQALNGYENIILPPLMKQDVCFWINSYLIRKNLHANTACVNCAVEASSLSSRAFGVLHKQDAIIQKSLTPKDTLIVSIGGNDIALVPSLLTVANLLVLSWLVPKTCTEKCACSVGPPNLVPDMGCCCGCHVLNCAQSYLCGWPPGFGYFVDLFKNRVKNYVKKLVKISSTGRVKKMKPRRSSKSRLWS
ncbi:unnamed protein product [Amoebophrya sp. A120]|nr:unnamed protein product [Amoebophrya sp. A120]|eukprot:GSA120T00004218001.1